MRNLRVKVMSCVFLLVVIGGFSLFGVELREVSRVALPGVVTEAESRSLIHVYDNYLAVTRWDDNAFYVYDLTDKSKPECIVTQEITDNGNIHDLWYANGYIYFSHRYGSINMYNIKDAYNPYKVDYKDTLYSHKGLTTNGRYLFLAEHSAVGQHGGFRIYNVGWGKLHEVGSYFAEIDGRDLVVTSDGKYLYQLEADNIWADDGLHVFDVSNKTSPRHIAGGAIPGLYGHELILTDDDQYLYVSHPEEGIKIISLANPVVPEIKSSISLKTEAKNITLDAERNILLARTDKQGFSRIHGYDVTDPAKPVEIVIHDIPGNTRDGDIWADNGYIYYVDKKTTTDELVILTYNYTVNATYNSNTGTISIPNIVVDNDKSYDVELVSTDGTAKNFSVTTVVPHDQMEMTTGESSLK